MNVRGAGLGAACLLVAVAGPAPCAQKGARRNAGEAEKLFLNMTKVNLGTLSTEEDKKKYLYTIQLEKARITRKTLQAAYENAHDLYRSGDYEGARELTAKILNIDPGYEDAAILQRAATQLQGSKRSFLSENQLVEFKFGEGMNMYRQGRLVEAAQRLGEASKLAPYNLKARYWLRKLHGELAQEHYRRGQTAYRQHRLRETLDQWYAALVLHPHFPRLAESISKVETELRRSEANEKLQSALQLYSQGRSEDSLKALEQVLLVQPSDAKAQRLMSEIRAEMANQFVAEGRRLYNQRQYPAAIVQWKKAVEYGYDASLGEQLATRARDAMRRETEEKKRREEAAQRHEEEDKRKAEEEAKAAQEKAAQPSGAGVPISPMGVTEENRRSAIQHWNLGIISFQKGDYDKARDEWILCKKLDPSNSDCLAGLQRIEAQLGGP
ncbi:MAG: hypothetical protein HY551_07095 [Elusimicrobia bacterium]|nr:hypothetical protein [Elusimicrobiota bacterium]